MIGVKYFLMLTTLLVVVEPQSIPKISPEEMQALLQYHKDCKLESHASDNLAYGTLAGQFPEDPRLKKHVFCMSKKIGFQDETGKIQRDVFEEQLQKLVTDNDRVEELIELCSVQHDDPEETAMDMAKCYYKILRNTV
nr:odorant binding protein [Semanotus bifasciatus]